jgi:5-methylcytosine-specific restriction protein A
MPNWEGSDRRERLPDDWPDRRRHVLARDAHRCQHLRVDTQRLCGKPATDVDHIRNDDDHSYSNLQALCTYHHRQKSGREGGIASGIVRRKAREGKPQKKHPGLL